MPAGCGSRRSTNTLAPHAQALSGETQQDVCLSRDSVGSGLRHLALTSTSPSCYSRHSDRVFSLPEPQFPCPITVPCACSYFTVEGAEAQWEQAEKLGINPRAMTSSSLLNISEPLSLHLRNEDSGEPLKDNVGPAKRMSGCLLLVAVRCHAVVGPVYCVFLAFMATLGQ